MKGVNVSYTHLVLGGGGLSGFVYIGIYRFFKEHDLIRHLHYVSGTSIGAFFAFLIGIDVDYEAMEAFCLDKLSTKNSMTTFDPKSIFNARSRNGLYSCERFRSHIADFLRNRYGLDDITFAEYIKLTGIDLHIHVTALNTYSPLDLSNTTHPEMSVITAVIASMSVPLFFEPVVYKDLVLVDGGCCANMEIYEIAKNKANKVMYITLSANTVFTTETLMTNTMTYMVSVILTMVSSHIKKIVEDYRDKIEIIEIYDSPIPFAQVDFIDNIFYTLVKKEQIDASVVYGYQIVYAFFGKKGYFDDQ
jgi:predicted acylesterase/phospholipase RssA